MATPQHSTRKEEMQTSSANVLNSKPRSSTTDLLNKVPGVTLAFWTIKILSTTVGETGADYLAVHAGLGKSFTAVVMAVLLIIALVIQVRADKYVPWKYWVTVVLLSVVGTQITDLLTDGLGVSLFLSTAVFSIILAAVFAGWYWSERTLSIHSITTRRRELLYWLAILFTFALGTASGDLATEALHLGFRLGVVIFAVLIALIFTSYRMGANAVATFWFAYILTRPLGASLGDLLSQARQYGGLGWGTVTTSLLFLVVITALVVAISVKRGPARPAM